METVTNTPPGTWVVDADYHQINLYSGAGLLPDIGESDYGPLLAVGPTWLIICTGVAMGWVRVTVSTDKPAALGATPEAGWEVTAEASITTGPELWLASFNGDHQYQVASDLPPGPARIRVSARGRALNFDGYVSNNGPDDDKEDYLVTIWPTESTQATIHLGDDHLWGTTSSGEARTNNLGEAS